MSPGFLTDHLGLITILNIQAAGYMFAGLLVIVLLPREKKALQMQTEPAMDAQTEAQEEGEESTIQR